MKNLDIAYKEWARRAPLYLTHKQSFEGGIKYALDNLWKDAQSDDLPEIDREVIALVRVFPEGHDDLLKVSFAHRPPLYWEGKSLLTGEMTRREPMRFGKGGWNIPDVVWWLDLDLPKKATV